MQVIPAILPKSFREIEEKTALVRGAADTVQVDICDGQFTLNRTWPFAEKGERGEMRKDRDFAELLAEKKGLPYGEELDYEFDLMVTEPQEAAPDFVRAGASRIIVHIESIEPDALSVLIQEWKHAVDIGLALKPSTPLKRLETFLHEVTFVQCMGNDHIGFQGVSLDEETVLPKIAELRKRHPRLSIGIDIGVNMKTAPRLIAAGANRLVAGSAIFGALDPKAAIAQFQQMV